MIAAYCRVSTQSQKHDSQESQIKQWIKANGINARSVKWYHDKKTGKTLDRKAIDKLKTDVESGKIKTLIIVRLDRLARSCKAGLEFLSYLTNHGVRTIVINQGIDTTSNKTQANFLSSLFLAIAQLERDILSERITHGIAAARFKNGGQWGRQTNRRRLNAIRRKRQKGMSVIQIAQEYKISRQAVYQALKKTG